MPFGLTTQDPANPDVHRPNRRLLYLLVGIVLVVALFRATTGNRGSVKSPALAGSCTQPSFALSAASVPAGGAFRVAITGPPKGRYVLYLDVAAVAYTGGRLVRTPEPGIPVAKTQVLAEADGLPSCLVRQGAALAPDVAVGHHKVALFRVEKGFGETRLATLPLTVS